MAASAAKNQAEGSGKFMVVPLIVLIMAQMGTSGDNGALSLATAQLTSSLGASMADIQLANTMYSLVAGALMVAGGMMGTIIGWKKNFRIGTLLAACGEFAMAFSPSMIVFTWGGRLLVGFGASFLVPSILGLVPNIYKTNKDRAMAFGGVGAATGLSMFLPLIMGALLDAMGFRVTFGVLGGYFLLVFAASFAFPAIEETGEKLKFDAVGTVLAALGLFLFIVGISQISTWGLTTAFAAAPFTIVGFSPALPLALVGLIILAVMFKLEVGIEKKNGCALLPQSFLKTPQVLAGLAASAITFFFMGIQAICMTPYMQLVGGLNAVQSGLVSLVYGIPMFVVSLAAPRFLAKVNPKNIIRAGYVAMVVSLGIMSLSFVADGISMVPLIAGFACSGLASGLVASQASTVVALAINDRDAAQSGGVQATCRNVGQAIAVASLGAILLFSISSTVASEAQMSEVVSPEVAEQVAQRRVSLVSDEKFVASLEGIDMTAEEQAELVRINAEARVSSTKTALAVGAVIIAAGLLTTGWIKTVPGNEE